MTDVEDLINCREVSVDLNSLLIAYGWFIHKEEIFCFYWDYDDVKWWLYIEI